jgi:tetratricopeptide (TPR) repeat protein
MTRRAKKQRSPRSQQGAFPAVDRRAPRVTPPVRRGAGRLAVCGILLLAVIAVFGQTARHEFVNFDDDDYVCANRHVTGGLSRAGIAWAVTTLDVANWHPLTWLSHMLDCQLYDLRPVGHHLSNVLLHAATAVFLFLTLQRMTRALWPSACVAALFAIHPLRVESVAWVAERKDVLSGLFFVLTLWSYARYAERPRSWGRYWLVAASLALGLTAKPMLVSVPLVLLLLDYWPLGRGAGSGEHPVGNAFRGVPYSALGRASFVRLIVEKLPLMALSAASCLVTLAAQRNTIRAMEQMDFPWRAANATVGYVAYLGKMFYPAGLAVLYPLSKEPPPAWDLAAAAIMLAAISAAAFTARRNRPYLLFGWLWYLATLAPVIGLLQVGIQSMADRYTYLTQIGPYTAIAWSAADLARSKPHFRSVLAALSAAVLAGLMICAWRQTGYWRSSETLWSRDLACAPEQNSIAHNNLGNALAGLGRTDEAIEQYRLALAIKPDYVAAYNNLGLAFANRGEAEAAIALYRKALEINGDYVFAYNNLGLALAGVGRAEEAVEQYEQALKIKPDYVEAHDNLGRALARRGAMDEAIAHFRRALEINADYAPAHKSLGLALAGRGQLREAIEQYRLALKINPGYLEAHYNLGNALADGGHLEEALAEYRTALEIKPDYVDARIGLGDVLAGCGQTDAALDEYRRALALAYARNDSDLAGVIGERMKLWRSAAPLTRPGTEK